MPVILVIDDEPSIQHAFRRAFHHPELEVLTASSSAEGLAFVGLHQPDVVVLDVKLPDESGLETYKRIRQLDARIPVIFITGHGTTDTAIEAMKLGAYDYLLKPLELEPLRALIDRACEVSRISHVPAVLGSETPTEVPSDVLVGRCPAMQEVYKAIGRVAAQDVTVLILGESGSGKELVARALYQHSRRASGPFLAINCAAIPETLLESELFGHEKGAFTSAASRRIGKFEQCTGGTIFLDEVGDLPLLAQGKLLRVLQEQRFERVGGNETVETDVRVIAATNRNLEELVNRGGFRGDLFYRLSVFTITLPPVRERGDDLPLLVEHFVRRFNRELSKDVQLIAPETLAVLRNYSWPGNVRELQSVIKQALLQTTVPVLLPDFLPAVVLQRVADLRAQPANGTAGTPEEDWGAKFVAERIAAGSEDLYAEALAIMERQVLTAVLRHTGGNQVQAARILGIARNSLRSKIKTLRIQIERTVSSEDAEEEIR
jgi:two-component system nitrogen regulation response regulator GlnG